MVLEMDVKFPLGRVCLGYSRLWCVFGGCLGLGPVGGLAWGFGRCVWSSYCFVVYVGLL